MEHLLLSCIESRVENNRTFYGRFQLGPFDLGQGLTVANGLRRTLLSEISGLAIAVVEIEGATHEYSSIVGIRESVLDILLNLKQIVLTSDVYLNEPEIGYLQVQGPGIVRTADMKLPLSIQCVDPDQYIATVADDGVLTIKFIICQGKNNFNFNSVKLENIFNDKKYFETITNPLSIDSIFMPVKKVNYLLETDDESEQPKERVILEIWTNGSIHPRQAIHDAAKVLVHIFAPFQETNVLKSVFFKTSNGSNKISLETEKSTSFSSKKSSSTIDKKLASLDIGNLDLSLRPYTCLKRANIHTVADLLQYSREELLLLKNFGKRSLEEVETNLYQIGLKLTNTILDDP